MVSKLSFHISGYPDRIFNWCERAQFKVLKVFEQPSEMNIAELQRVTGALIVYRMYTNENYRDISPEAFVQRLDQQVAKLFGRGLVFEGINEPQISTRGDAQVLNDWYIRFARLMHAKGEKVAAFSFSTGNPPLELVQFLTGAAQECDYIALHEYHTNVGYYRQIYARLPVKKPILMTETGFDLGGGAGDGYRQHLSEAEYLDQLKNYDGMLQQDSYLLGATIFQLGAGGQWASFEFTPIAARIADYVASQGGGAPIPAPFVSVPSTPNVEPLTAEPSVAVQPTSAGTYTVQRGDTLFRISKKFGVTVDALVEANHIQDRNVIPVGLVLTIPPKRGISVAVAEMPEKRAAKPRKRLATTTRKGSKKSSSTKTHRSKAVKPARTKTSQTKRK